MDLSCGEELPNDERIATQRKIHQGTAVGTKKIDLVYFIKPNFYPCLHAS